MPRFRPLMQASMQAAVLSSLSNFLAQLLSSYNSGTPFVANYRPIIKFFVFTIISTPPNYVWQSKLEQWYPSYADASPAHTKAKKSVHADEKPSLTLPVAAESPGSKRLRKSNVLKKLLWDQFLGSPINNALFLMGIGFLSGYPWEQVQWNLQRDFWRFQKANWKLWPLVAVISFSLVPVERRVLFGSLIGLLWTVYVSFLLGET